MKKKNMKFGGNEWQRATVNPLKKKELVGE
jgi:hypothetical protein